MAEVNTEFAGLSLPPKVEGRVSGHLVMKVDEVLWARKPPGEVSAVVMWWGDEEPTTFRPCDVAENAVKRKNSGVIYEIRTTLPLFEKYLCKCGSLEIAMADMYGMPIGCVTVPKLRQMIKSHPYQGYYPIVNNFGNRIGDLHVSFNLRILANAENIPITTPTSPNKQGVKTKDLKRLSSIKSKPPALRARSKEEKTEKNEKVLKNTHAASKFDSDMFKVESASEKKSFSLGREDLVHQEKHCKRVSPTTNIISQILEHGTRLRDAMAASALEDCVQLDFQNLPKLNAFALSSKEPQIAGYSNEQQLEADVVPQDQKKVDPIVEKKVLDYLSGRPMTEKEEKEALAALRSMTPTTDIVETSVPAINLCSLLEESPRDKMIDSCESSEVVTKITDYYEKSIPASDSKQLYDVDSQLLSQVNCLRITVHSLVINAVGMKRIRSPLKKKGTRCQSSTTLQPPGITYFVEYQFPLTGSRSRPWESTVRYCSKRFSGHEVSFGDRTVHNLPTSWRHALSDESSLGSLISSLGMKVCARHLHQRIPVLLGSAELNTVKPLFDSANLRHDFDLPVIATDRLPVAQLKLCVELGRDRIHFGGLLDPENNSLGLKSPKVNPSLQEGSSLLNATAKKKPGRSFTTVTRNITPTLSSASKLRNKLPVCQAAQADQVIKQIVKKVNSKRYQASESSSAPSTGRPHLKPVNANLPAWNSTYEIDFKSNLGHLNATMKNRVVKHEMALNILEIVGMNFTHSVAGRDQGFYVTYRFPVFDVTKNKTVNWHSFQTELSVDAGGKWKKPQYKIHSMVLSESESLHSFLKHAVKMQGESELVFVTFLLYARYFGIEVKDQLIAEATLPMSTISMLEDAYVEAARKDPNFSSSSCSSVLLELVFDCLPLNQNQEIPRSNSNLQIKLDYRHSKIDNLHHQGNLPHSRGDSVSENIPCMFMGIEEPFELLKDTRARTYGQQLKVSPLTVPHWARSDEKQLPISLRLEDKYQYRKKSHDLNNVVDQNQVSTPPLETLHATWAPMHETHHWKAFSSKALESKVDPNVDCPYGHEECKTASTTISCAKYNGDISDQMSRNSLHISSEHKNSQYGHHLDSNLNVDLSGAIASNYAQVATLKRKDVATSPSSSVCQKYSSSNDESPPAHQKSDGNVHNEATRAEKAYSHKDKAQQVVISNVNKECQTTPREKKVALSRDVGVATDLCGTSTERNDVASYKAHAATKAHPCGSIDDIELVEIDSYQPLESKLPVHDDVFTMESRKQDSTMKVSPEEVPCISLDESSDNMVHSFGVKIGVDCALHLQSSGSLSDMQEKLPSFVFVSLNPCEVDAHLPSLIGSTSILLSHAVMNNGEPVWHWQTNVELPSDMLYLNKKRLIFKVWQSFNAAAEPCAQDLDEACLIGFSALDLTVLSAGLPLLSGWYNIMDFTGACQGQIKLSVEPLEKLPKTINFPLVSDNADSQTPLSLFVAHCVYKEFPSHVVQFPDMCVQKVDPQTGHQAISAVLSSYQDVIQRSQKQKTVMPHEDTSEILVEEGDVSGPSQKISSEECNEQHLDDSAMSRTSLSSLNLNNQNSATNSDANLQNDPSQVLREKLSELDRITKCIQSRLVNRVESSRSTGSSDAIQGLSMGEALEQSSHAIPLHADHTDKVVESLSLQEKRSHDSVCNLRSTPYAFGTSFPEHLSRAEEKKSSQKQRKMWEKQEDLIDFGALCLDCESDYEKSPSHEELSDWLSESALQQVFNPFLFNDLLNNMNSGSGVKVIELDDTETSDENLNLAALAPSEVADSTKHEGEKKVSLKATKRRCRRGDETYRKEMPPCGFNGIQKGHTGVSVCDTDSGVDVDVSANFNPSAFMGAARVHHHMAGACATSTERNESSSCSHSSRHYQSTLPSSASASATPSDSPQHSRHDDSQQLGAVLGNVPDPSRCARQHRKN